MGFNKCTKDFDLPQRVDLSDVVYADDHSSFLLFRNIATIHAFLVSLFTSQLAFHFSTNFSKSVFMVHCAGEGSRSLRKRIGKSIDLAGYGAIKVVQQAKHTGSFFTSRGSPAPDAPHRKSLARAAYGRLSRNILHCKDLPISLRISLYVSLVRSVLLHHAHVHIPRKTHIATFERFQNRALRAILDLPAHSSRTTNHYIRQKANIHSVESILTQRRLKFWRDIIVGGSKTIGSLGVLLGKFDWEDHAPLDAPKQNKRLQTLSQELAALRLALHITPIFHPKRVTPEDLIWLSSIGDDRLKLVLSFHSTCDPKATSRGSPLPPNLYSSFGRRYAPPPPNLPTPSFTCDICQKPLKSLRGLNNHKRQSHQFSNPQRSHITTPVCPACNTHFSTVQVARNHFEKRVCVQSRTYTIPRQVSRQGTLDGFCRSSASRA